MVINFKWQQYTERFFMRQFIKSILFIASFITDITLMNPNGIEEGTENALLAHIITRTFCGILMIDHFLYE